MTKNARSLSDNFPNREGDKKSLLKGNFFPTRKNEVWHYTSLQAIDKIVWGKAPVLSESALQSWLARLALPHSEGRIVFANGRYVSSLSFLPEEVIINHDLTSGQVSESTPFLLMLNEALRQEGLELTVPENCHVGTIILLSLHEGEAVSTHLRHKISLGKGASLTILEINVGCGVYLSNPVFDIDCAESAHFTHIKEQSESKDAYHLAYISSSLSKKSIYEGFTLQTGAKIARHEVKAELCGEQAIAHVNAIQVVSGKTLHDLTSRIHHESPHCQSRQTVRTVLQDEGIGVFQGKILVDQKAQKTDGYQMNQALLLSDMAQMNSKPELEIYADDVRCSHGATIGALDEEQLFYLRSRGIAKEQARSILIRAFLNESLELLENQTLRDYLLVRMNFHD